VIALVMALLIAGCGPFTESTHSTTLLSNRASAGQVIYSIAEETAFTTALDAYAVLLPKQGVDAGTTWTKILVRAIGTIESL
jgi:hypothetical protein